MSRSSVHMLIYCILVSNFTTSDTQFIHVGVEGSDLLYLTGGIIYLDRTNVGEQVHFNLLEKVRL